MFSTIEELVGIARSEGVRVSELMIRREVEETGASQEDILRRMDDQLGIMEAAAWQGIAGEGRSASGLTGGDAKLLWDHLQSHRTLLGREGDLAISLALAVSETNAGMGRIIATPTAGAAGILPGVLFALRDRLGLGRDQLLPGVFTAGAIGLVIANNASISGAGGGCQAEVGSATAMAAGAAVELAGGPPEQVAHAVGLALKNVLGLVCDPVAGLVEIPCIVRNGVHAVMALAAADMALAGIRSAIPADEVIATMHEIGNRMPRQWKETALGGLAATPTGQRIRRELAQRVPPRGAGKPPEGAGR